jgi:chromosome partitioning protein
VVLLIDLDPQANLTQALGVKGEINTIYGALTGAHKFKPVPISNRLFLMPNDAGMEKFEKELGRPDAMFLLRDILERVQEHFDYILLDCPPALGLVTINALVTSDTVLIPMEAQEFSVKGLEKVCENIALVQKNLNTKLKLGGAFFTKVVNNSILHKDTILNVRNMKINSFRTIIRTNISLQEAPSLRQDIFEYAPESNGAKDYAALCEEFMLQEEVLVA